MSLFGSGNPQARIMVVGEAFTETESLEGRPFLAQNGLNLNNCLFKAGILPGDCYLTNLFNFRPQYDNINSYFLRSKKSAKPSDVVIQGIPCDYQVKAEYERLWAEINLIQPEIIVCFGDWPLWALTGAMGSIKWRGSILPLKVPDSLKYISGKTQVITTLSLKNIAYNVKDKNLIIHDCTRIKKILKTPGAFIPVESTWKFAIRPSLPLVQNIIQDLINQLDRRIPLWIDFDLETRAGHIACAGISWTKTDALCIPLMCVDNYHGYWTEEEEAEVIFLLYRLLTHPQVKVRGQNLLYDCQYTYRHWHFIPRVAQDTMISHHTCFSGLSNSLAFQASLYCDNYVYWKDDGKTWTKSVGEDQLWRYNAVDCVRTRECGEVQLENLKSMGLETIDTFQQRLFWPVLRAMLLGVRIELDQRKILSKELKNKAQETTAWFQEVLSHEFNPKSSKQMVSLFYTDLGNQRVLTRAKKGVPARVTCNEDALQTIAKREPLMRPLVDKIVEYRSLGVLLSTFIEAKLDSDNRMRCSYNVCGTDTYRLSSSKNAFDSGTNLQNVPSAIQGINIKKLFIPDEGYTFFDCDLDRADLQVVAWEAEEEELQAALIKGVDMHLLNAAMIFGYDVDMDLLIEGTDTCEEYKSRWKKERIFAKAWVHGTDYGGSARTMAIAAGCTVKESEKAQASYFGRYKGIKRWHDRVAHQLKTKHYVENILGYRKFYFEDPSSILPEALAWIPQSTVACVINRVWVKLYEQVPDIQVLLQVHDSLAGQFLTNSTQDYVHTIKTIGKIELPYPKPLIIPLGVKTSELSWGDCK